MPNPPASDDFRNVCIKARGELLRAIEARAAARNLPLGLAAASLIKDALEMPAAPVRALVTLEAVSTGDIIDELVGRLQQIGEIEAAVARAEAAEARLAMVASALAGGQG
ncbi:hypothetical protein [uncultured Sphingomonas sp.]|uniref:hypothetical protein n=1 Tax=uncultured Sphingomonas sp. TaxID=158754 RepID=UPI00258E989C|nr:hypothetical protein [uncultured Sphingomonas sp.]